MRFYVVTHCYYGPNPDQYIDADEIYIQNTPAITNTSHEPRIEGWCGTTNDWSVDAYGEFNTLEDALDKVHEISQEVREIESGDEDVVKAFKFGDAEPMNTEETRDYIYPCLDQLAKDLTDEQLAELEDQIDADAKADGQTIKRGVLEVLYREYTS